MEEDVNDNLIISPYSKFYDVPIEQHCGAQLASYWLRDLMSKLNNEGENNEM